MNGIRHNERVLVLGQTGKGKSVLLNHLFTAMRCQRALVDTKDEWTIPGVPVHRDSARIDWTQPIIHFRPRQDSKAEFNDFFASALRRRHLSVCVHELGDLCDFNAGSTPSQVSAYLSKGRAHGDGLLGGSQRPFEMPKRAKTEAQHVLVIGPPLNDTDMAAIAQLLQIRAVAELEDRMNRIRETHGEFAFHWYDRGTGQLAECKPLDAATRGRSIVRSVTVA